MPADKSSGFTSFRWMAHPLMNHVACENTKVTVYSWVEIQTQARQLKGECTYLKAILSVLAYTTDSDTRRS